MPDDVIIDQLDVLAASRGLLDEQREILRKQMDDFFLWGGIYKPAELYIDSFGQKLNMYAQAERMSGSDSPYPPEPPLPTFVQIAEEFEELAIYLKMLIEMGDQMATVKKLEENIR